MYGVKLYYIVSLHQTTTTMWCMLTARCCIISFLYIKPQQVGYTIHADSSCIISFLYIKPQPIKVKSDAPNGCIISFLYIKPQPSKETSQWPFCCIIYPLAELI